MSSTSSPTMGLPSSAVSSSLSSSTSSSSSGSTSSGTSNSTLYLFTFLATLFLLLCISSAIILRSFLLRRRFRQRIEHELASGALLTPDINNAGGGGRGLRGRRDIGEKPKFYDSWVVPLPAEETLGWSYIQPVSARTLIPECCPNPYHPPGTHEIESTSPSLFNRILHLGGATSAPTGVRSPQSPSLPPPPLFPPHMTTVSTLSTSFDSEKGPELHSVDVQVSVLVAMPHPHNRVHNNPKAREVPDEDEEGGVPDVAVGVATVSVPVDVTNGETLQL